MHNLSFPYIWSNRKAPLQALIASALLRPQFEDLTILAIRHGMHVLRKTMKCMLDEGQLSPRPVEELNRILNNIEAGIQNHRRKHPGCRLRIDVGLLDDA